MPNDELMRPWSEPNVQVGLLSGSTWSLALIAHWRATRFDSRVITIFVPDYFCESALSILRIVGFSIHFYEVRGDLSVDMSQLRALCQKIKPDLIVMVHYFGSPNKNQSEFREFANVNKAWLIEDCAHYLIGNQQVGQVGDFALYSPHKIIASPSGAVLVARFATNANLTSEDAQSFGEPMTWSKQLVEIVEKLETGITPSWIRSSKWLTKRLAQRLGIARKPIRPPVFHNHNELNVSRSLSSPEIGRLGRACIAFYLGNANPGLIGDRFLATKSEMSEAKYENYLRQSNSHIWDEVVQVLSGGKVYPITDSGVNTVPYLVGYRGDEADVATLYELMASMGLPVTTWPDLPREVVGQINSHKGAHDFRSTHIYLPVHRSIRRKDILKIVRKISGSCKVDQCKATSRPVILQDEWEQLMLVNPVTNLLQSWSYGQAKAKAEAWDVRRVVYSVDGRDVAIAQLLVRRMYGVLKITRLSRGPIFFPGVSNEDKCKVLTGLVRESTRRPFNLLSIEPELLISESIPNLGLGSLVRISPIGSESVVINLNDDDETRRRSLNGKWRNQLALSERSPITIRHSTDHKDFNDFENSYFQFMEEKKFAGIPRGLFREIWLEAASCGGAHLFVAEREVQVLGSILVVAHGSSATYLASWNGVEGRKVNCNNQLLWRASCYLKELETKFLDLGGIDEIGTPTISAFKLGMGGHRYRTIGEFLSF